MRADILPVLAAAAGVDIKSACDVFDAARAKALKANGGRDDTRTFLLTVEGFRAKHPFSYAAVDTTKKPADATDTDTTVKSVV